MKQSHLVMSVIVFGVIFIVGGFIFDDRSQPEPKPLAERCSDLGGEWIYKSANLLCLLPNGDKLAYNRASDAFLPFTNADSGAVVAVAQAASTEPDAPGACSTDPVFTDYPASMSYTGRPKVDFSTYPAAQHYHTAITKDVARGVNFAGGYVVSTWGCGDGCVGSAVVNAETGKILAYGLTSSGFTFEPDSSLFDAREHGYFVVKDDAFNLLCN